MAVRYVAVLKSEQGSSAHSLDYAAWYLGDGVQVNACRKVFMKACMDQI